MEEIRKCITGYEGLYQVSNLGRIRGLDRKVECRGHHLRTAFGKTLNPTKDRHGYLRVSLSGKVRWVARLVAINFIENALNYECVNHIDGNPLNNNISNLEWCTYKENQQHAYKVLGRKGTRTGKYGKDNPNSIKVLQKDLEGNLIKTRDSIRDIEKELGFGHSNISYCCRGKIKTSRGFLREYASKCYDTY